MRVQSVRNNQNPSFSALLIKRGCAEKFLSACGKKNIEKIDAVGELLKDTKYYHLSIEEEMVIRHVSGERLYGPYIVQNVGDSLIIKHKYGTTKTNKRIYCTPQKQLNEVYEKIKSAHTQIERTALIVKSMDAYEAVVRCEKAKIEIPENEPAETKIEKLINKYGV